MSSDRSSDYTLVCSPYGSLRALRVMRCNHCNAVSSPSFRLLEHAKGCKINGIVDVRTFKRVNLVDVANRMVAETGMSPETLAKWLGNMQAELNRGVPKPSNTATQ